MTRPRPRTTPSGVGAGVVAGLEVVLRDWAGRVAMFTGLLLVLLAALSSDAGAGLRAAGVVVGTAVVAAVVLGWWRRAPGPLQWSVAAVGVVLTVGLSVLVGRA